MSIELYVLRNIIFLTRLRRKFGSAVEALEINLLPSTGHRAVKRESP